MISKPRRNLFLLMFCLVLASPFMLPEQPIIPIQGAGPRDWNPRSFWHEPWGVSGVHKGIDIFAKAGTPVVSPVAGWVVYAGEMGIGGNVVLILGPGWRLHYLAHLKSIDTSRFTLVRAGAPIGQVGSSGNAAGKPPHLHYAIVSALPRPWAYSAETQGWKKMFFLDPGAWLGYPSPRS